jgi:sulfide:quinone oxidoreductase
MAKKTKSAEFQYELLHVTPPCLPIEALLNSAKSKDELVDNDGWVAVNPKTLQSKAYSNVFGIGDANNAPTAKTAAAASVQFRVIKHNLTNLMNGKDFSDEYDGYSAVPLMVDAKHVCLAEFDYTGPIETTLLKQKKPSRLSFLLNRYIVPAIYWKLFLKGLWNGPEGVRKAMHLGLSR